MTDFLTAYPGILEKEKRKKKTKKSFTVARNER